MRPIIAIDASLLAGENTGDSSYWTGLIKALGNHKNEFDFALLSTQTSPPIPLADNQKWVHVKSKPGRWSSLFTFPLTARRLGAKCYHTQYTLSPLAKNGITTIHDVSFLIGPQWFLPKDRFLLRFSVPKSAHRAKKIITVSQTSKKDIVRLLKVPENKVAVTYNAPDPIFKPTQNLSVIEKLKIQKPYLLTVGTRWPRKNLKLAIEAVHQLPSEIPHQLVITGKAGWGENGASDRIFYTGYLPTDSLPTLYSAADLYLCTSFYEGFGIPVVEAFACGCPVVASVGGALPEIVGDAGCIVNSWRSEDWANTLTRLLKDSSNLVKMREQGLARAKEFSWQDTATKTIEVYREAIQ